MFNVDELFLSDTWPDPGKCWMPLTPIDFSKSWGHSWYQSIGLVFEMAAKASFGIQTRVSKALQAEDGTAFSRRDFKLIFLSIIEMDSSQEKGSLLQRTDTTLLPVFAFLLFSSYTSHCPLAYFLANMKRHLSSSSAPCTCLPIFLLLPLLSGHSVLPWGTPALLNLFRLAFISMLY